MKRKFLSIAILLFFTIGFTACTKEWASLTNTKWQLLGFVDAVSGEMKEVKTIGNLYTLTFYKNGKIFAISSDDSYEGKYKINYINHSISITTIYSTLIGDDEVGNLYMEILEEKVNSFSAQENELKLYYNDKQNYLLYKPQKK